MLKVWLYAYAVGLTSSRRLEQRIREDLAFRYLAGGAQPDYWALNAFRRRHGLAINDAFTQVLELARELGMRQLGTVAVDTTRVKASASPDKMVQVERQKRARIRTKVRRWQKACNADDNNEGAGTQLKVSAEALEAAPMAGQLEPLPRPRRRSITDPDAGLMSSRGGFVLGYSAQIAVSDDHLIVAQRVIQHNNDNDSLPPMVELVRATCRQTPGRVVADSGFYSNQTAALLEQRGIDAYVPDSNLACELNLGNKAADSPTMHPQLRRMRQKLRTDQGVRLYARRKALVEPVFGVLKEQRGMSSFRMRGLSKVSVEFTFAAMAYNISRIHRSPIRINHPKQNSTA
jgi:hypothetical protein